MSRKDRAPEAQDDGADLDLVAQWRQGDDRAATALVARHGPALARFAVSLGEREDIEELVQDTFVRAFGSLDSFRGDSTLRTWLFTIERRLWLDRRRSQVRRRGEVSIGEQDATTAFTALDGMVAAETEQRIREAVERLSPMQREVFTLRVAEGLSYKEIAEVLDSTEGAARVHYHNALCTVKELLHD